jgi:hypothetical protein
MKRVGDILRTTRIARGISIDDVERATKIRAKFIKAIETEQFHEIPSLVYTKGFIKNYSDFLGLDTGAVLAFFRRQMTEGGKGTVMPKTLTHPFHASRYDLTPGKFIVLLFIGLILLFAGYFFIQYRRIGIAPMLSVTKPMENLLSEERKIDVVGQTNLDSTVMINGISTIVRSDGTFFDQVTLEPGMNSITITATSRFGKVTSITRKVGLRTQ